jgi:hypothetical protein
VLAFRDISSQARWYVLIIPALGRLRQEDHEFEAMGYIISSRSAYAI